MSSQDGRRSLRVAELARAEFTRAVLRRIDDPRLRSVMVANVSVSDDLSVVDIGVPNYALAEYKAPDNYVAADCPLCRSGVPVTTF